VTTATTQGPVRLTPEQRRTLVQQTARRSYSRRVFGSYVFIGAVVVALLAAFIPLASIIYSVVSNGWRYVTWTFLTSPQLQPGIFSHNVGGISNAIIGSVEIDGLAIVIAIPLSIVLAIAFYELPGRAMAIFRRIVEVMVGLPSILFGLFIFAFFVTPLGYHYCALAGTLAIALLMIPVMTVASADALAAVPSTLTEAALSLGARRSRIMLRVILPYAVPRMLTGILLSLSRAVGETAPVLLIINSALIGTWNPWSPATTMPLLIYNNLQSYNPAVIRSTWGIALILIAAVFLINLTSRLVVALIQGDRS
jgi:phosphate transport system permease protein